MVAMDNEEEEEEGDDDEWKFFMKLPIRFFK